MHTRATLVLLITVGLVPASASAYPNTFPPVRNNPADRLARYLVDDYRYDHASKCVKYPRRGMLAFQAWLQRHARGRAWGILRCEKLSRRNWSLHAEGRALDWGLDVHDRTDRRGARKLISLLLATDRAGNLHALARRMGIQEIIWNCRAWWSGPTGMSKYSRCYTRKGKRRSNVGETIAHRDHIHFGLSKAGAARKTTYWNRSARRRPAPEPPWTPRAPGPGAPLG